MNIYHETDFSNFVSFDSKSCVSKTNLFCSSQNKSSYTRTWLDCKTRIKTPSLSQGEFRCTLSLSTILVLIMSSDNISYIVKFIKIFYGCFIC